MSASKSTFDLSIDAPTRSAKIAPSTEAWGHASLPDLPAPCTYTRITRCYARLHPRRWSSNVDAHRSGSRARPSTLVSDREHAHHVCFVMHRVPNEVRKTLKRETPPPVLR